MKNSQKIFAALLILILASFAIPSVGFAGSTSVGPQRTMVILVTTQDAESVPASKEQINDIVFNGQFNNFIKEASYNKTYFVGDVYGWFTLPRNMNVSGTCTRPSKNELSDIISQNNISVNNYDRVLVLRNFCGGYDSSSLPGQGIVIIGDKTFVSLTDVRLNLTTVYDLYPFTWNFMDAALAHEFGHALGLLHDNFLDCGLKIIPAINNPCSNIEYGNSYDVMGSGSLALHYNALYKEMLGWLDSNSSKTIINSGSYILSPLEASSTGIKLIKVQPISGNIPLYAIEYRRAIGFDSNLATSTLTKNQSGIIIYKIIEGTPQATQLLNMHPNQLSGKQKLFYVALGLGETFVDSDNGITVGPVTRTDDKGAVFDVSLNQTSCISNGPKIEVLNSNNYISQGGEINPMIKITNQDTTACGTTQFLIRPTTAYSYFSFPAGNKIIDILPGNSITTNLTLRASIDAGMGNKIVKVLVTNNTSGLSTSSNIPIKVVRPPVITDLSIKSGKPGDIIEILGGNFTIDGQITFKTSDNLLAQYSNYVVNYAGRLYFVIPDKVYSFNFLPRKLIPTPDGKYIISLNTNGKDSNGITFTVSNSTTPTPPQTVLNLKSVSWMTSISSGNTYYNPRVNFGGVDQLPFNDTLTATKWCQAVPGKTYASGTSTVAGANPTTGDHYRFNGSLWANAGSGFDYPRYYTCSLASSVPMIPTGSLTANVINTVTNTPTTQSSITSTGKFNFTQFLSRGSYGDEVAELQKVLSTAGYYSGNIDGNFGVATEAALIQFQTANKLKADGIMGYEVRSFLNQ